MEEDLLIYCRRGRCVTQQREGNQVLMSHDIPTEFHCHSGISGCLHHVTVVGGLAVTQYSVMGGWWGCGVMLLVCDRRAGVILFKISPYVVRQAMSRMKTTYRVICA